MGLRIVTWLFIGLFLMLCAVTAQAEATPERVYHQALQLASAGKLKQAVAALSSAKQLLPAHQIWQQRMTVASMLLQMRIDQSTTLNDSVASAHFQLVQQYVAHVELPKPENPWLPGFLATIFPGSGHAWLGRWHDAYIAALLVWPILLLTLWAGHRAMGPVTVFFGMLTAWSWSGTVFSAFSLSQRTSYEVYLLWWQGLWQASALPGLMP